MAANRVRHGPGCRRQRALVARLKPTRGSTSLPHSLARNRNLLFRLRPWSLRARRRQHPIRPMTTTTRTNSTQTSLPDHLRTTTTRQHTLKVRLRQRKSLQRQHRSQPPSRSQPQSQSQPPSRSQPQSQSQPRSQSPPRSWSQPWSRSQPSSQLPTKRVPPQSRLQRRRSQHPPIRRHKRVVMATMMMTLMMRGESRASAGTRAKDHRSKRFSCRCRHQSAARGGGGRRRRPLGGSRPAAAAVIPPKPPPVRRPTCAHSRRFA